MRIKVIVPVSTDIWNDAIKRAYDEIKDIKTEITIINLSKGTESIEQYYDITWAELETLREAEKAEEEGYDAVVIYCFSDPGLFAIREKLRIPVVGLRESSIHVASMLARKFSIVGVGDENSKGKTYDAIKMYGLEHKLASIRMTKFLVLDIAKDIKKIEEALLEESRKAIEEDGAEAIILSCGSLIGIGKELQEKLSIPVIEPGLVALKIAELLVDLGLSHSKLAFRFPHQKKRW
ncbi:MAG: aspartate/glutamate racemase family protein [Palaeococcus sp.]|uniref:aspartate/glutamate racemase family protein n=1 Tax=Palaeococcus sp. (in: euryarchaeotes) TaxID=2820298 RepID=UPI002600A835|nr:aspartate/glutamate racemase family protein [Palaeococcus sp. (in: euryarchaeotes)]MCD6559568.1 aspartate/glutamate racemase family protein [Palaeococcus sp. (in: euryarchaeotes)]